MVDGQTMQIDANHYSQQVARSGKPYHDTGCKADAVKARDKSVPSEIHGTLVQLGRMCELHSISRTKVHQLVILAVESGWQSAKWL